MISSLVTHARDAPRLVIDPIMQPNGHTNGHAPRLRDSKVAVSATMIVRSHASVLILGLVAGLLLGQFLCAFTDRPVTYQSGRPAARLVNNAAGAVAPVMPLWPRTLLLPSKDSAAFPRGPAPRWLMDNVSFVAHGGGNRSHADVRRRFEFFLACLHNRAEGAAKSVYHKPPSATVRDLLGYGDDAGRRALAAHAQDVFRATSTMRGFDSHGYRGYGGPWIENHFIQGVLPPRARGDTLPALDWAMWEPLVPLFVQWTDAWVRTGASAAMARIISGRLASMLRRDVLYVAVVQFKDGLQPFAEAFESVPTGNILVISAGGYGHVPIPLLKGVLPAAEPRAADAMPVSVTPARRYVTSFVGTLYPGVRANMSLLLRSLNGSDSVIVSPDIVPLTYTPSQLTAAPSRLPVVSAPSNRELPQAFRSLPTLRRSPQRNMAVAALARERASASASRHLPFAVSLPGRAALTTGELVNRVLEYEGPHWEHVMRESSFSLAPRGLGRTSFRLFETMHLGLIPIYVWDDYEWLPYTPHPRMHTLTEGRLPAYTDVAWLAGNLPGEGCMVDAIITTLRSVSAISAAVEALHDVPRTCCAIHSCTASMPVLQQLVDVMSAAANGSCALYQLDPAPLRVGMFSVQIMELPILLRVLPAIDERDDVRQCMLARVRALQPRFTFEAVTLDVLEFIANPFDGASMLVAVPKPP